MTTAKTAASPHSRLITQIVAGTLARTVLNTSRRFIYPFAPVISRGLGVPITSVSTLLAVNQAAGLASPFFGPVSDRMGYRFTMLLGLGLVGGAMLASGLFPIYAVLLIALFFAGMGRGIYDPALQAFAGQNVPYAYRGRVIGLIEMSWSASSLIGIPLVGLLIARQGWRSPFLVLGMACLGLMLLMGALIPAHAGRPPRPTPATNLRWGWPETCSNAGSSSSTRHAPSACCSSPSPSTWPTTCSSSSTASGWRNHLA